jgi:hypothetical protein
VLLLVASAVVSLYTAVLTFRLYIDIVAKNPLYLLQMDGISWPCKQPTPFKECPFETFLDLMTVLLPSGTSIVSRNLHQHSTFLSPRHHSYWHLYVVRAFRNISFTYLSLNLSHQVLYYLTRTKKQVYVAHTRKVCLVRS